MDSTHLNWVYTSASTLGLNSLIAFCAGSADGSMHAWNINMRSEVGYIHSQLFPFLFAIKALSFVVSVVCTLTLKHPISTTLKREKIGLN